MINEMKNIFHFYVRKLRLQILKSLIFSDDMGKYIAVGKIMKLSFILLQSDYDVIIIMMSFQ